MSNVKNIIIILIVIAVVGGGVYWYRQNYAVKSDTNVAVSVTSTPKVGQKTLTLLGQVKALNLDTSIFNDQAFISLQEYNKIIPEQPVGRINPFAPLKRSGATTVKATSSNTIIRR